MAIVQSFSESTRVPSMSKRTAAGRSVSGAASGMRESLQIGPRSLWHGPVHHQPREIPRERVALLVPARPGEHTADPPRSGSTGCCPPVHGLFSPRWATGGGRNGPHGGEEPFVELGAGLLPRLVVHFLPGGGHREGGDEPVGPGPLVAGQRRVLPAVLFPL